MIIRQRLEPAGNGPGENDFLPLGVDDISIDNADDWQEVATEHKAALRAKFGSLMAAWAQLHRNGCIRVGGNGEPETSIYLRPEYQQPDEVDDDETASPT